MSAVAIHGRADATPEQRAESDRYAADAVLSLRKAVTAGYKNLPWIARDPALEPIRGRDDFRQLVAELEKAPPAGT